MAVRSWLFSLLPPHRPIRTSARSSIRLSLHRLEDRITPAALFAEFVDPHPAAGNKFGSAVVPLTTGNVVITSPFDDAAGTDAGAVYLFNGTTGALISAITGSHASDLVGSGGVTALTNGNFVIESANWDHGSIGDAGAATFGNGVTGVSGVVSAANSLVGSTAGDGVGSNGIVALTNGNYVVASSLWDNGTVANVGAATFGNGTTGTTGVISVSNSLIGSTAQDGIGNPSTSSNSARGVVALTNGNYVVRSARWDNGAATNAGAVSFGNGTTGTMGVVSSANSLVGSHSSDVVGADGVTSLPNGNYVVSNTSWDNGGITNAGAATFGNGATGVVGVISASNSLIGSTDSDMVGSIKVLANGNYVVRSPNWDRGAIGDAGAVTFGSGAAGVVGLVSTANSLVGSTASDRVGDGVTALTNGNYVVASSTWDNGAVANVGASTFGNGTTGVVGIVSAANSLIGSTAEDRIGGATALTNGNYVVGSSVWDNGNVVDAGAVTFCNGATGLVGVVSPANSLVGSTLGDSIGNFGVTPLTNGNYVVISWYWNNGAIPDVGAATWGNGTTGTVGVVSPANSLVGSSAFDQIGDAVAGVVALSNGNYVVETYTWDNGGVIDAGAATFGNGNTGVTGVVSAANSFVGSTTQDRVSGSGVFALANGNYLVAAGRWDHGGLVDLGAVTFANGNAGVTGVISASNSLVGSSANDLLASIDNFTGAVRTLPNGNYVVLCPAWDNGPITDAGSVSFGNGTTGVTGPINSANSALGGTAAGGFSLQPFVLDNVNNDFYVTFLTDGGGRVRVGSQTDGFAVPATTLYWKGGVDNKWSTPANWSTTSGGFTASPAAPVNGDTLVFDTTRPWTIGAFSVTNDLASLSGLTIQVVDDSASGDFAFGGNGVGPAGSLSKSGTGTLTLSGADTYAGGTTVSAGKLLINGSHASAVTASAGTTLGGSGTIAANVSAAGTVAPGTTGSVGTLTTGDLALGGTLSLDLMSIASYDSVTASSISLANTVLSLNIGVINDDEVYTILSVPGTDPTVERAVGTFNGLPTSGLAMTVGGRQFAINYTGGDGNDVTLTALPAGASALVVAPVLNGGSSKVNSSNFTHQHSLVESIVYTFSQAVNLTAANLTLTGLNGTTLAPAVTPIGSSGNTVWTVTFAGDGVNPATHSLGDGEYRLALNVGSISNTYDFFRLLGDLDGNGITDFSDFQSFNSSFNRPTTDPLYIGAADFDGSNTVDFSDFQIFNSNFNRSLPAPLPPN